jgi:outer membrane lipoprotein SlyB
MKRTIFILTLLFLLESCAYSSLKPDTFDRDSVQRISNVLYGEVVSLKKVSIEGSTTPGTIVGGLVGAAAGSEISNSKPESEIGAVLGGAIGATLGGNLSKSIQTSEGIQLTINMDDGRTISVVQEVGTYNFIVGDLVEVITTKGKTRVSPSGIK